MFGIGYSRLFKSRWAALLWAAGVLFSAWSFASDPPAGGDAANGADAVSNAQIAAIANAF